MRTLNTLREQAPCLCMYHWGETAQVECSISAEQTLANRTALATEADEDLLARANELASTGKFIGLDGQPLTGQQILDYI